MLSNHLFWCKGKIYIFYYSLKSAALALLIKIELYKSCFISYENCNAHPLHSLISTERWNTLSGDLWLSCTSQNDFGLTHALTDSLLLFYTPLKLVGFCVNQPLFKFTCHNAKIHWCVLVIFGKIKNGLKHDRNPDAGKCTVNSCVFTKQLLIMENLWTLVAFFFLNS